MWNTIFFQPLLNALIFLYNLLGQNLGWAIIGLTLLIRGVLTPLTLPSLKSGQKMKELQPELNKLKEKYGQDKQVFAKKQLELFQSHGVNPAAGCLPQIIQYYLATNLETKEKKLLSGFLEELRVKTANDKDLRESSDFRK